ncbi:MAG: HAMP domain-containing sensor histidine kinase [Candidatus Gracilibacteria bacterium]|nr:HAMP domain-containing sensor histidine kinase [Candidatus Gracilibacteria bacterium]
MKTKLGIKTRIFITFGVFIVITINIFSYLLYTLVSQKFIENITQNIDLEYQTITNFIDLQKDNIFVLSDYEIKNINSLGFFFYLGNNDNDLKQKYKLGLNYYDNNKNIIFRGDYKGYNVIIGKNIDDLSKIQAQFVQIVFLLNLFLIVIIFIITYFLTSSLLKPLGKISEFIKNYDLDKQQTLIKNEYGNTEIGNYISSTNAFISKIKDIFNSQKDFIQDVSHELKTPLMQIDSSIEIIENKINDEKILSKLENIKSSVRNINSIISNLSFLLRGEEKITKKETIDFKKYFENKLREYEVLSSKKNIKINLILQNDLIIESNVYYIDRLFDNIISNAIYYNNGNNEIKIIISTKSIKIIDEGIGINSQNIKKIFNRFYRDDKSVIYSKNGSGLGLSIVKKITNMFGWKINLSSQEGVGTEFEIMFSQKEI